MTFQLNRKRATRVRALYTPESAVEFPLFPRLDRCKAVVLSIDKILQSETAGMPDPATRSRFPPQCLALLALALFAFGAHSAEPAPLKLKVLFIGNSLTS